MKKIFLFLVVLAGLVSCQVIKPEDRYIKVEAGEEGERNVLLVDFTGWKCPNCPEAAKVANALTSTYGDHVIVVSMHPEGLPFTDPGTTGPKFATKEAKEYLDAYGGSSSLPVGVVDGQEYDGSYFLKYQDWASVVTERLKVDVEYSMEMTATTTSCSVTLTKNGNDDRDVNVVIWLLEDSIIAPQSTTTEEIHDYAHRHVFRKCLNGEGNIWGEAVEFIDGEGTVKASYKFPELEGANFVVVAVAVDAETKEVLQAEEIEFKQQGAGSFEVTDEEGNPLADGDTVHVTHFDEMSGQMGFYGYIISKYADEHEFTIVEDRDFDYSIYTVTMCVFGECRADDEEYPGVWGPYLFDGLQEVDFQSHVIIPEEQQSTPVVLNTTYHFSDGVTTISIPVVFHYTPLDE